MAVFTNTLTITGPNRQTLHKFSDENASDCEINKRIERLSFQKSVNGSDATNSEWRIQSWGCSTDAEYVTLMQNLRTVKLEYYFMTRTAPPFLWLTEVSKLYPKLSFYLRYQHETFACFGFVQAINGIVTYLDNYKEDDIIQYLIKECEIYPVDLVKLAIESGLAMEVALQRNQCGCERECECTIAVCNEHDKINWASFNAIVNKYIYVMNGAYEFNVDIMLSAMKRALSLQTNS